MVSFFYAPSPAALLYAPSPAAFLAVLGLLLVIIGMFMAAMLLVLLCTRFRDMPQIVGNLLQLAFFVTPIMWHVEQLGRNGVYIAMFNPFASFLRVVSEPLLGRVPTPQTYLTDLVALGMLTLVAWRSFAKFRARIVYWL